MKYEINTGKRQNNIWDVMKEDFKTTEYPVFGVSRVSVQKALVGNSYRTWNWQNYLMHMNLDIHLTHLEIYRVAKKFWQWMRNKYTGGKKKENDWYRENEKVFNKWKIVHYITQLQTVFI